VVSYSILNKSILELSWSADADHRTFAPALRNSTAGVFAGDIEKLRKILIDMQNPSLKSSQGPSAEAAETGPRLRVTTAARVPMRPVDWLVPDLLPAGKLVLMAGEGGLGKSTLTLDLAARLSRGEPAFGLDYPPVQGRALMASCEDDREDTVVPRLRACGADLERVDFLDGVEAEGGERLAAWSLAHHEALEAYLKECRDVRLVVIDPAAAFAGRAGVDGYKDAELRALLGPLADLAAAHRIAVLLVCHMGKANVRRAIHRVLGSVGWVNAARAALLVCADPDHGDCRLVLPLKSNLSPSQDGVAYRLEGLLAEEQDLALASCGYLSAAERGKLAAQLYRPVYLGPVQIDPDAVLAGKPSGIEEGGTRVERAAEWVRRGLQRYAWPCTEVEKAAHAADFTRENLQRAKARLAKEAGLRSCPLEKGGPWWIGFGPRKEWNLRPSLLQGTFGVFAQYV
jgi:hypothetical protein